MKIFVENPKFYHYPLIQYYLWRKADIYVFDFEQTIKKKKWLRELVYNKRISNISHYIKYNDSLALDNIEKVYSFIEPGSKLIKATLRLYNDEDITLSFRKVLAKELSIFYAVQTMLSEEMGRTSAGEKIAFIPHRYFKILRVITQSGAFSYSLKNISIPFWSKFINAIDRYFSMLGNYVAYFLSNICSVLVILFKILILRSKSNACQYQYAIAIDNPSFQFKFKEYRTFDFLLDNKNIRKDNTVFLWRRFYDKEIASRLSANKYNVVNLSKKNILLSGKFNFGKNNRAIFKKVFLYTYQTSLSIFSEYDFNLRCGCSLLGTYLLWSAVLTSIKFNNYITFNDEEANHIGRNILLRHFGCKTWCYAYSSSFGFIMAKNAKDIFMTRHWLWSFLYYDCYIGWNRKMIEYQKLHWQKIGNYYNVGCLWSEFVANGKMVLNLNSYLERHGMQGAEAGRDVKVVSFFDTSFFDGIASEYPLRDGIKFYNDILRLLGEMPNLFVIVKEKKQSSGYKNKSSFIYSADNEEFIAVLDRLKNSPNCCVAGSSADPVSIIKVSDLVVSYAFSSSAIEALGARKKAIFYDPMDRLRRNCYEVIPNFLAHGYEELKELVNKLIFEMTEEEYDEYLDREILNTIDDYLDGKAITRFRDLLSNKKQ